MGQSNSRLDARPAHLFNRYVYWPELQLAVAVMPKSGYGTFNEIMGGHRYVHPNPRKIGPDSVRMRALQREGGLVAQFVRHPLERLFSQWRYLGPRTSQPPYTGRATERVGLTWPFTFEEFVHSLIANSERDEHTALAYWQHTDEQGRIPTFLWPFERLDEGWANIPRELPKFLPRVNSTTGGNPEMAPVLHTIVEHWLERDFKLYEEAREYARRFTA